MHSDVLQEYLVGPTGSELYVLVMTRVIEIRLMKELRILSLQIQLFLTRVGCDRHPSVTLDDLRIQIGCPLTASDRYTVIPVADEIGITHLVDLYGRDILLLQSGFRYSFP